MASIRNSLNLSVLFLVFMAATASSVNAQDYSGWWWDPDASGTGYALDVQELPDKDYDLAYLVWYAYDESGLNTWYSSIMKVLGDRMIGELVEYTGWPLEPGIVTDTEASETLGTVLLNFTDINTGSLSYIFDDGQFRHTPLQRWEPEGDHDSRNITGWWWDEDKPGIGWFIEARNNRLFLGWYNYREDPEGMARWYISLDNSFTGEDTDYLNFLLDYSGGQTLTGDYAKPTAEALEENLSFSLPYDEIPESIDLFYDGISYNLTRFTVPNTIPASCEPVVYNYYPAPESSTYKPRITCSFLTPCGCDIDPDSLQMWLDGETVQLTSILDKCYARIQYQVPEGDAFAPDSEHTISVTAADMYGESVEFSWTFFVPMWTER